LIGKKDLKEVIKSGGFFKTKAGGFFKKLFFGVQNERVG
jgi:endonuclease III-like uncharacterized protein